MSTKENKAKYINELTSIICRYTNDQEMYAKAAGERAVQYIRSMDIQGGPPTEWQRNDAMEYSGKAQGLRDILRDLTELHREIKNEPE